MAGIRNIMPFLNLGGGKGSNRRKGGRVNTDGLTCSRGSVVDLSNSGARVATRFAWREGCEKAIAFHGAHLSVRLKARCIWARRDGFMDYVIGVAFEQPSPEQLFALQELVRVYGARLERREAA